MMIPMKLLPFYLQDSKKFKAAVKGEKGFSLVEIIAAIVILGLLAVFITTGTVRIIEGYFFSRDNSDTAMRGQIAITRISKELRSIEKVNFGVKRSMSYSYKRNGKTVSGRTLFWSGITSAPLMLDQNILVDNVTDFEITYHQGYNDQGNNIWSENKKIIGITLKLKGASDHISLFSTRILSRNL